MLCIFFILSYSSELKIKCVYLSKIRNIRKMQNSRISKKILNQKTKKNCVNAKNKVKRH